MNDKWKMLERREKHKVTSGNGIHVPQLVCVYALRVLDGDVLCELRILSSDIFIVKKLIVWHSKCMHLWTLMVFNAIQCRIFVIPAINDFIVSSILSENKYYCIIDGYQLPTRSFKLCSVTDVVMQIRRLLKFFIYINLSSGIYANTQSWIRYSLHTDPVDPHKMLSYSRLPLWLRVLTPRLVIHLGVCPQIFPPLLIP